MPTHTHNPNTSQHRHTSWSNGNGTNTVERPGRQIKSPAYHRQQAANSTAGGTAVCHVCLLRFAAYYMDLCYISTFRSEHVCKECQKSLQYQRA